MNRERIDFKQADVVQIPGDWQSVKLDDVAKRGSGHTPDKKHPEYWNGNIKWVSLRDSEALDKLFVAETAASITPAGIANSSAVLHPAGTVILSRDAGVGKSAILGSSMAVSQHFMAWQCGPKLDNVYLYYWLQRMKPEFERIAMGSTIKTIGLPYFEALRIPLPPRDEQSGIAAALRRVDECIEAMQALIAKKRDLKQAVMQQLLTARMRLPSFAAKWKRTRLGAVLKVRHGRSQHGIESPDGAFPILATGGEIGRTNNWLYDKPSVLIGRKGTINKPQYRDKPFWTVDTLFYTELADEVVPKFIHFLFSGIDWLSHNEASGVPSLNAATIEAIEVSIPEYCEQQAIANVISEMDAELESQEQRCQKMVAVKQAMMQQLLTGRIRLI